MQQEKPKKAPSITCKAPSITCVPIIIHLDLSS